MSIPERLDKLRRKAALPARNRFFAVLACVALLAAARPNPQARSTGSSLAPSPWGAAVSASAFGTQSSQPAYETRQIHDPNGTGRFYMGREIAQVMGPGGIPWLDRPEREHEEHPADVIEALDLREGQVVADLGAGTGYFTFLMAPRVGKTGRVLAVDLQDEMLDAIRKRAADLKLSNVEAVKDTETNPRLPAEGVDLVLMVDVYHELAYPFEVMTNVLRALKPDGRVAFVEYRKEDARVRIKEVHKMALKQLDKEMKAVGLVRVRTVETLPLQHIAIYQRQRQ